MDVLDTLDALEDYIRESPWLPLAHVRVVDRDAIDQLLRVTRQEAERAQQAPPPVRSRDEVLGQAAYESKLIIETARRDALELLRDERIKALSRQRFDEIVGEGKQKANRLLREAYDYSVERMTAVERSLDTLHGEVETGLTVLQRTARDADRASRQRKKEASRARAKERRRKVSALASRLFRSSS
jgi:cell division septum initiation protein DivIVA